MKLEIGKNQGYVIVDDKTGQILSIFTHNVVDNRFDGLGIKSYKRIEDRHYKL